jgi:hypothetical protein
MGVSFQQEKKRKVREERRSLGFLTDHLQLSA